jgi:outer membrane lipoprotein SlyB
MGAVLGGVVGGVAGGVIGNKMDKQARQIDEAIPGAEVKRVGEGIQLMKMRYVLILINQVLQMLKRT